MVNVTVKIEFDNNSDEIGWYIADENQACYRVGILNYPVGLDKTDDRVELRSGEEYIFVIESVSGNGLGKGSYSVESGNVVLASGMGDFGHKDHTLFTAP